MGRNRRGNRKMKKVYKYIHIKTETIVKFKNPLPKVTQKLLGFKPIKKDNPDFDCEEFFNDCNIGSQITRQFI